MGALDTFCVYTRVVSFHFHTHIHPALCALNDLLKSTDWWPKIISLKALKPLKGPYAANLMKESTHTKKSESFLIDSPCLLVPVSKLIIIKIFLLLFCLCSVSFPRPAAQPCGSTTSCRAGESSPGCWTWTAWPKCQMVSPRDTSWTWCTMSWPSSGCCRWTGSHWRLLSLSLLWPGTTPCTKRRKKLSRWLPELCCLLSFPAMSGHIWCGICSLCWWVGTSLFEWWFRAQ